MTVARDGVAQGRTIGRRALATRRKLLEATERLLNQHGVLELRVVDITRDVGTSAATFYQYFEDVDDAMLALAEAVGAQEAELARAIAVEWVGEDGFDRVLAFIEAYRRFWVAHRGILRVRNLRADEGHRGYRRARRLATVPMAEALGRLAQVGIDDGRLSPRLDAFATGGALLGMIDRLFVYESDFVRHGTRAADLRSTVATIVHQTLSGAAAVQR